MRVKGYSIVFLLILSMDILIQSLYRSAIKLHHIYYTMKSNKY